MPNASRRKGFDFERELVGQAPAAGIPAERARGSDGRALGEAAEVDLLISGLRVQAKRRKTVAQYLHPPDGADVVVLRADRSEALAVLSYTLLLQLLTR